MTVGSRSALRFAALTALVALLGMTACSAPTRPLSSSTTPPGSETTLALPALPREAGDWTPTSAAAVPEKGGPMWDALGLITYEQAMLKASDVSFPSTSVVGEPTHVLLDHRSTPNPVDYGVVVEYSSGIRLYVTKDTGSFDPAASYARVAGLAAEANSRNPVALRPIAGRTTYVDLGRPWEFESPGGGGRTGYWGGAGLTWVDGARVYRLHATRFDIPVETLVRAAETIPSSSGSN